MAKIPGTPAERRALHFFFSKTAPNIAGFFEPVFWTRIVIQLAQTEPAVRYAVQAIGATYAANTERDASALLGADDFALKAYNKAISAIVAANPNAEGRKKMTLITCVLFVCIEFMRGEMEAAVKHIHSGLKLLSEWNPMQSVAANGDRRSSSLDEPSDKEMCDDLTAMFSRLHLQAKFSMHSQPPTWHSMHSPDKLQPDSIATFTTLSEARDTLFSIASECVAVILPIVEAKYAKRVQCEMMVQQRRLESHLRVWRRHFESSIAVKKAMCTTHLAAMGNMLMIYAISMHIWVAECLSAEEEVFDKYGGEYETVVALAKGILDAGAGCERTAGAAFQFELGIIPPLHMIGSKCRFPELRRQILDILTSAHWREGLFDSVASARFIELVARVEAEEVDPATNMPTERARVHFADQAHFLGRPQVENSDRRVVLFLKPEGVYGPWVMREEVLDGQVWVGRVVDVQHI